MAQPTVNQVSTPGSPDQSVPTVGRRRISRAQIVDVLFTGSTRLFALSTAVLIIGIAVVLYLASRANIHQTGVHAFLSNTTWDPTPPDESKPMGNLFGALPFIYGTLITSAIAMLIAVPVGVGAAIYLSEVAPRWLSTPISFLVELLAAVPSIVYGFWALKYLVPMFDAKLEPWIAGHFGKIPFFAAPPESFSGQDYLVAGTILSLMVLPFITAISRDVLRTVPVPQREAAYGMGATRWEAIRSVVLRYGSGGIIGASMLGLGRALGETMAVTIVVGSAPNFPKMGEAASWSLMRPGYTMASLLADQYPNPNGPLHGSALTEIAFLLFVVTIVVNGAARSLVWLTAARTGGKAASDTSLNVKAFVTKGLKSLVAASVAGLMLYQIGQDVRTRGAVGLFGFAEFFGLFIILLAVAARVMPTTKHFPSWRKLNTRVALTICFLCVVLASGALLTLLYFVARDGIGALNPQFFRRPDPIHPESGGMLHAIVGTSELVAAASIFGIPVGVLGGLFLAEFGNNRLGGWTRFAADLLNGVPSIVIGIFAYTVIIVPTRGNFGVAGAFALGIMMIPTIMRTTEELVRLVPMALREGSLALGATHAKTIWSVVLPTARGGIVTGALLAVARIAGETAPLLMVSCNSSLWVTNLRERMSSLPVQIYVLRDEPSRLAAQQSWGVALVLVLLVLIFSILARFFTREKSRASA